MIEVGDNGYCDRHGGRKRLEDEWASRDVAYQHRAAGVQPNAVPNGQAVAPNNGLSRFSSTTNKEVISSAECNRLRQAREARVNALRQERLNAQPKKGKSGGGNGKKGKKK
ncbi:MAG: hypothetical protein A2725_01735 [Candidatus Magasanikbacteria bacterium RIFCSPHIGHO2_01_FULL_33_34]|uniref:Uncharacterized protein n=1 Tax=Candidatus Magasanikbacteria bacterium RIFCSPHIGHO2_01_FULL_33_34 TaxID=1798671 RepID=A0A1F6LJR2_9BACT|nr:MAG: hypothetical protein A2725_01735 [Candidatus Magasanikbacteria bacterium RIFCSPHIGHO2_01_FULL_33_34]OGH65532.1 MAG: hypothetical protein A3B83_01490 [Candidatus Magasanikbacteria bacterium RIFCSPHIGHO2_02_FULL_33_17]OGH76242.1 MAG: hypothetical protein A3A89_02310 [Candidatus Magasanikbacteria bacterium RIFCSPLOWO2_01_FULL_33_34]